MKNSGNDLKNTSIAPLLQKSIKPPRQYVRQISGGSFYEAAHHELLEQFRLLCLKYQLNETITTNIERLVARYNSGAGAEEVLQRSFFSSRRVYRSRSFHDQLLNTLPRSWFPLDCIFGSFPKRQLLRDVNFILIQHEDKHHLFSNILEGFELDKADQSKKKDFIKI